MSCQTTLCCFCRFTPAEPAMAMVSTMASCPPLPQAKPQQAVVHAQEHPTFASKVCKSTGHGSVDSRLQLWANLQNQGSTTMEFLDVKQVSGTKGWHIKAPSMMIMSFTSSSTFPQELQLSKYWYTFGLPYRMMVFDGTS